MKKEAVLILDNLRSVENVGAIFRTADAAGVSKIFLIGTTPTPVDRFGRARRDFVKTALGAEKTTLWEHSKTIGPVIKRLKAQKFLVVALEQAKKAINYKKAKVGKRFALIVGNEVSGINKKTLDRSDLIIEIVMRGKKESLNVSVATGIALFRLRD